MTWQTSWNNLSHVTKYKIISLFLCMTNAILRTLTHLLWVHVLSNTSRWECNLTPSRWYARVMDGDLGNGLDESQFAVNSCKQLDFVQYICYSKMVDSLQLLMYIYCNGTQLLCVIIRLSIFHTQNLYIYILYCYILAIHLFCYIILISCIHICIHFAYGQSEVLAIWNPKTQVQISILPNSIEYPFAMNEAFRFRIVIINAG